MAQILESYRPARKPAKPPGQIAEQNIYSYMIITWPISHHKAIMRRPMPLKTHLWLPVQDGTGRTNQHRTTNHQAATSGRLERCMGKPTISPSSWADESGLVSYYPWLGTHKIEIGNHPACSLATMWQLQQARYIIHRLTNCLNSARIWRGTSARLAMMLRIDTRHIPAEWTRPDFHLWPPQRHQAILWTIAHLVGFLDDERDLTLENFIDFLRRARWKL